MDGKLKSNLQWPNGKFENLHDETELRILCRFRRHRHPILTRVHGYSGVASVGDAKLSGASNWGYRISFGYFTRNS